LIEVNVFAFGKFQKMKRVFIYCSRGISDGSEPILWITGIVCVVVVGGVIQRQTITNETKTYIRGAQYNTRIKPPIPGLFGDEYACILDE
jgi:hypothetical protein